MNYPCNFIRDMLPLYHDEICSDESNKIIEEHLTECDTCKEFYTDLCKSDGIVAVPLNTESEIKKAGSFKSIKKRLRRKQLSVGVAVLAAVIAITLSVIGVLKNTQKEIAYNSNISVSLKEGSLVGRLAGNEANRLEIKRVDITADGKSYTYLFFRLSGTKWAELTTSKNTFSEYSLCPEDKNADSVDGVYYYNGDFEKLEEFNEQQIANILDRSQLLWSKQ